MPAAGSTLLAFNTVERLLKGDIFHTVTLVDVAEELGALPAEWPLVGQETDELAGAARFVAVAACDPDGPTHTWRLEDGDDVHGAIAARCGEANVGLAALVVTGELRDVGYQVMCHLPVGGIRPDHEAVARHDGVAAVHLHGQVGAPLQGGHVNRAVATRATTVDVRPIPHLVMRIHGLDVAVHARADD